MHYNEAVICTVGRSRRPRICQAHGWPRPVARTNSAETTSYSPLRRRRWSDHAAKHVGRCCQTFSSRLGRQEPGPRREARVGAGIVIVSCDKTFTGVGSGGE